MYACTVVIRPDLIPKLSSSTLAIGAKQFVVHDALETILSSGFKSLSFTPKTIVASISSLGGTVSNTFLAPADMCLLRDSLSLKIPVDSITTSTSNSFHGSSAGSFIEVSLITLSPTKRLSPSTCTSLSKMPITESCFKRYARFS